MSAVAPVLCYFHCWRRLDFTAVLGTMMVFKYPIDGSTSIEYSAGATPAYTCEVQQSSIRCFVRACQLHCTRLSPPTRGNTPCARARHTTCYRPHSTFACFHLHLQDTSISPYTAARLRVSLQVGTTSKALRFMSVPWVASRGLRCTERGTAGKRAARRPRAS